MANVKVFDAATIEAIKQRRPFVSTWITGYLTQGGSYMLASSASTTDSGRRRDLMLVLPAELEHGRVLPVYVAVNPDTVAELERALAE